MFKNEKNTPGCEDNWKKKREEYNVDLLGKYIVSSLNYEGPSRKNRKDIETLINNIIKDIFGSNKDIMSIFREIQKIRRKSKSKKEFNFSTEPTKLIIGNYEIEIRRPSEYTSSMEDKERLQVCVTEIGENRYYYAADFVTPKYFEELFKASMLKSPEGLYIPGKDKIIVRDLKKSTILSVLEDLLIKFGGDISLSSYFRKVESIE